MTRKSINTGDIKNSFSSLLTFIGDTLEKPMAGIDKLIDRMPVSEQSKRNFAVRKYGIMGTISFHLLLFVFVLAFKINAEKSPKSSGIEIDMMTMEEISKLMMEPPKMIDEATRNARNLAVDQKEDKIESFEDYKNYRVSDQIVENLAKSNVDQTVKDIIKDNNLNPDNKEIPDIGTEELKMYRAQEIKEEQVYKGATNIYYSLEGRDVVYLEVPVYKCQGGGLVKLDIRVNRRGKVEWVSVDTAESETNDDCLINAAKDAAMKTRFTLNQAAVLLQQGSITYRFVAQ